MHIAKNTNDSLISTAKDAPIALYLNTKLKCNDIEIILPINNTIEYIYLIPNAPSICIPIKLDIIDIIKTTIFMFRIEITDLNKLLPSIMSLLQKNLIISVEYIKHNISLNKNDRT